MYSIIFNKSNGPEFKIQNMLLVPDMHHTRTGKKRIFQFRIT